MPFEEPREKPGRVYLYLPDTQAPSGGIRKTYEFVDSLVAAGVSAAVLHDRSSFRCSWFPNSTPITGVDTVRLSPKDVLVLSDFTADQVDTIAPGIAKVIINHATYYTFKRSVPDYRHPDVRAIAAVSEDGQDYLRYAFPGAQVKRIHYALVLPEWAEPKTKERLIAYRPDRSMGSPTEVIDILKTRGRFGSWEALPIEGLSRDEVLELLGRAAIFLSQGQYEGFPLLPAEAMMLGCLVVGFDGRGGREFFDPRYCEPVPNGDVLTLAKRLETLMESEPSELQMKAAPAALELPRRHSLEVEQQDLLDLFLPVLDAAAGLRGPDVPVTPKRQPSARRRRFAYHLRAAARSVTRPH